MITGAIPEFLAVYSPPVLSCPKEVLARLENRKSLARGFCGEERPGTKSAWPPQSGVRQIADSWGRCNTGIFRFGFCRINHTFRQLKRSQFLRVDESGPLPRREFHRRARGKPICEILPATPAKFSGARVHAWARKISYRSREGKNGRGNQWK